MLAEDECILIKSRVCVSASASLFINLMHFCIPDSDKSIKRTGENVSVWHLNELTYIWVNVHVQMFLNLNTFKRKTGLDCKMFPKEEFVVLTVYELHIHYITSHNVPCILWE